MKKTLLITTILGGLLSASNSYAQECTAAPDCTSLGYIKTEADCTAKNLKFLACPFDETQSVGVCTTAENDCASLGYTDTTDLCPGDYSICPHNTAEVKCQLDAAVGDLKFSWQTKNHDGWLACSGKTFVKDQFPELYALLGGNKLPDYRDHFLKGTVSTDTEAFKNSEGPGLPNLAGYVYAVTGNPDGGLFPSRESINSDVYDYKSSGGSGMMSKLNFDASKYNAIYGNSETVTPQNYSANVFIYAGKKGKSSTNLCQVGDYYYENHVCSSTAIEGQTALGVVFSRDTNAGNIALGIAKSPMVSSTSSGLGEKCNTLGGNIAGLSELKTLFYIAANLGAEKRTTMGLATNIPYFISSTSSTTFSFSRFGIYTTTQSTATMADAVCVFYTGAIYSY